jgi:hypothetical protein
MFYQQINVAAKADLLDERLGYADAAGIANLHQSSFHDGIVITL